MKKTTKRPRNNFGLMQRETLKHIKGNDLRVYADLLTYADKYGKCFPAVETIADDLGITPRNVQKHLANLESAGWIEKTLRTNTSTMYQVYFVDNSDKPKKKTFGVSKSDRTSKSDVSPPSKSDVSGVSKSDASGVSKSDVLTDQLTDHYNKPDNSVVSVPVPVVKSSVAVTSEKYQLTPAERLEFKKLWLIYGQEGESKRSAESVFAKYMAMGDPVILTRFNNFLDEDCGTYMTNQMNQIFEEYQADDAEKQKKRDRPIRSL